MRAFSQLLDDIVYTRSRNTKLKLIGDYLKSTPDPDRGVALAALTGSLSIPAVKGAAIRAIAEERVDPVLLMMSRDYVGDLAETVALLWPTAAEGEPEIDDGTLPISKAVERLASASRAEAPTVPRRASARRSAISAPDSLWRRRISRSAAPASCSAPHSPGRSRKSASRCTPNCSRARSRPSRPASSTTHRSAAPHARSTLAWPA